MISLTMSAFDRMSILIKERSLFKGSRCDFSHNISQSRTGKKVNVNPPKEVIEINNDVCYPITTLKGSNVSTNPSTSNELYAIPARITIRRRGKLDPQKFRRRYEHFFAFRNYNSEIRTLECSSTIGQPNLDQFGTLV